MSRLEFTRTQKYIIGGAVGLSIIAAAIMVAARPGDTVSVEGARPILATHAGATTGAPLTVHVVGAVNRPGVYQLRQGARVYDAVMMAGGMSATADQQQVNLAAPLQDGQQVYIPHGGMQHYEPITRDGRATLQPQDPGELTYEPVTGPTPRVTGPVTEAAPRAGTLPVPSHAADSQPQTPSGTQPSASASSASTSGSPASPSTSATPSASQSSSGASSSPSRKPSRSSSAPAVRFPINVNTATEAQLDALPGVGPTLASRIVLYRMHNGPFRRPQDLSRVPGIGDKTVARLAPYVTF